MVDENGQVVSQLCDENNNLGPIQFEQAMRKQARRGRKGGGEGTNGFKVGVRHRQERGAEI